ncbi:hypothetical protein FJY71_04540 [candidate division WOR-3 bacterium]|nr:hypothetical protein [candidate division WOR-3 bacterium]
MSHRRPRSLLLDIRRQHEQLERNVRDLTVLVADIETTKGESIARYAPTLTATASLLADALARLRGVRAHMAEAAEVLVVLVPADTKDKEE